MWERCIEVHNFKVLLRDRSLGEVKVDINEKSNEKGAVIRYGECGSYLCVSIAKGCSVGGPDIFC